MDIHEANVFGLERITAQQFQQWSPFLWENYARHVPGGFLNRAIGEGIVIGPQDLDDFFIQAFFQHFKAHFSQLKDNVQRYHCYSIEDTIRFTNYFTTPARKMNFDDYIVFLSKLIKKEDFDDCTVGNFGRDEIARETIGLFRSEGWKFAGRSSPYGGVSYFEIDPKTQATSIYYENENARTALIENLTIFDGTENPFRRNKKISFIGKFNHELVPFVNVTDVYCLPLFSISGENQAVRYSSEGTQKLTLPKGHFSI